MTFLEKITGSDITKEYKKFEEEIKKLPEEYQKVWEEIKVKLMIYSDFSGRNLLPLLSAVLQFLQEMNEENKTIEEIFGNNIDGFCAELTKGMISYDIRDKWRNDLNKRIYKKLLK